MRRVLSIFWRDDAGFIVSAELVLLGTLLVVGLITGLACVQEALIGEYQDVAGAIRSLDQSYAYSGMQGCVGENCCVGSWTAGSSYGTGAVAERVCFDGCLLESGPCTSCPTDCRPLPVPECLPHGLPDSPLDQIETPVPCMRLPRPCEPAPVQLDAVADTATCLNCPEPGDCRPCVRACGAPCSSVNDVFEKGSVIDRPLSGPLVW